MALAPWQGMPFHQVSEVLERIQQFHRQLRSCYAILASAQPEERTALLLASMERHEVEADHAISAFVGQAEPGVLATWIQYTGDREAEVEFATITFDVSLDAPAVVRRAIHLDETLETYCERLTNGLHGQRVRDVFQDLLDLERVKAKERSAALAQLQDA